MSAPTQNDWNSFRTFSDKLKAEVLYYYTVDGGRNMQELSDYLGLEDSRQISCITRCYGFDNPRSGMFRGIGANEEDVKAFVKKYRNGCDFDGYGETMRKFLEDRVAKRGSSNKKAHNSSPDLSEFEQTSWGEEGVADREFDVKKILISLIPAAVILVAVILLCTLVPVVFAFLLIAAGIFISLIAPSIDKESRIVVKGLSIVSRCLIALVVLLMMIFLPLFSEEYPYLKTIVFIIIAVSFGLAVRIYANIPGQGFKRFLRFLLHPYGLFLYCCLSTLCMINARFLTFRGINESLGTGKTIVYTILMIVTFVCAINKKGTKF